MPWMKDGRTKTNFPLSSAYVVRILRFVPFFAMSYTPCTNNHTFHALSLSLSSPYRAFESTYGSLFKRSILTFGVTIGQTLFVDGRFLPPLPSPMTRTATAPAGTSWGSNERYAGVVRNKSVD